MSEIRKRPTLEQLAADTAKTNADAGIGLACPKCGCRDLRVVKTRHNVDGTETSRRRECRNCNNRLTTMEIAV